MRDILCKWEMIAKTIKYLQTCGPHSHTSTSHPTTPHHTAKHTEANPYIRLSSPPPFCSPFVAASPLPCSPLSFVSLLSGFFPCR